MNTIALRNSATDYGLISRAFHWTMAVAVVFQLVVGLGWDSIPSGPVKGSLMFAHKSMGITLFVLVSLRYIWMWLNPHPVMPSDTPRVIHMASQLTHGLLYACLFLMPVSGLLMSAASGRSTNVWGLFTLSPQVSPSWGPVAGTAHDVIGLTFLSLIGLHAAAALFYHYLWRHDDVLPRMLHLVRVFNVRPIRKTRVA